MWPDVVGMRKRENCLARNALAQGKFLVEAVLAPRLARLPAYVQQSETRR